MNGYGHDDEVEVVMVPSGSIPGTPTTEAILEHPRPPWGRTRCDGIAMLVNPKNPRDVTVKVIVGDHAWRDPSPPDLPEGWLPVSMVQWPRWWNPFRRPPKVIRATASILVEGDDRASRGYL